MWGGMSIRKRIVLVTVFLIAQFGTAYAADFYYLGINGKWLVACELDGSPNRWRAKVDTAGGLVAGDLEGDGAV